MREKTIILGLFVALSAGCQSTAEQTAPGHGGELTGTHLGSGGGGGAKGAAEEHQVARLAEASMAFLAGDGASFASHYAEHAVMVLGNGVVLPAASLAASAEESGPSVKEWTFGEARTHWVAAGGWAAGNSRTVLQPPGGEPFELLGTRVVAWTGDEREARIQADLTLPGAPGEVPPELAARLDSLAKAWNEHDAESAGNHFADDALYILSDARAFRGAELDDLFTFAFSQKLEKMTYRPTAAWKAGDDGYYVASDFSFAMIPDGTRIEVAGCQLDFWRRVESNWKIAVEVAQPADSPACAGRS